MARFLTFASAAAIAISTLSSSVDAHTNMAVPAPKFPDGFYNGNSPMGHINGNGFAGAASIPSYEGADKLAKVMETEGYTTLRQLIMKNVNLSTIDGHTGTKECGLTITTGPKQPIPDSIDFPWGHPGPCEVWCDNNRIFFNKNCQANNVGKVKIDKTKCAGVNIIQAMYVGVHVANWEVYANCAPMEGGTKTDPATLFKTDASGGGASSAASSGSSSSSTTKAPATTSAAPSANGGSDYDDDATTAPASSSVAPTPSTTKKTSCKRRVRN